MYSAMDHQAGISPFLNMHWKRGSKESVKLKKIKAADHLPFLFTRVSVETTGFKQTECQMEGQERPGLGAQSKFLNYGPVVGIF